MQSLTDIENSINPVLYRGIDWLRIGYYLSSNNSGLLINFLEELKDIIRNKEYEERFLTLNAVNELTGEIEEIPFRVKTTAHIYPYIVMLVYEPLNISIRLGRPLRDPELDDLAEGKAPTPNLMIELTGTSLRPQKLTETFKVLKTFFQFLHRDIGTIPLAFTFSRIDYALDFRDKNTALNLLLEFEKLRKITIQTDEAKFTLSKSVKHLREEIIKASEYAKHIGLGDPRRLLVVLYLKSDADRFLQEFYYAQSFFYEFETPYRIEARFNTYFFTQNREIYFIDTLEDAYNLENLINEATELAINNLPERFKTYATLPHKLFEFPNQLIHRELEDSLLEKTKKITRKLTLEEEALRFLSQLIRLKTEWDISADELITTLAVMIKSKHWRIVKKAKEKKMEISQLFDLIPSLYK